MILKQLIRRAIIGAKADSPSYVSFLRKKGVKVGRGLRFSRLPLILLT